MKEIGDWIEETYLNFVVQENKDPRCSAKDFLQRYVFADVYENFFGTIHIELHQWLSRLAERRTNFQVRLSPVWTPARVNLVRQVNNEISHAVDFWLT